MLDNALWPSNTILRHGFWSWLIQTVAYRMFGTKPLTKRWWFIDSYPPPPPPPPPPEYVALKLPAAIELPIVFILRCNTSIVMLAYWKIAYEPLVTGYSFYAADSVIFSI